MTDKTVEVGGPYVENKDFVPNPTDIHGTYITDGVGPHQDPERISPIFAVDKVNVAKQVVDAFDPKSPTPASSVVLPSEGLTATEAQESITKLAKNRLKADAPVVVGDKPKVEKEAEKSGKEGDDAAKAEAAKNADATGTGAGDGGAAGATGAGKAAK